MLKVTIFAMFILFASGVLSQESEERTNDSEERTGTTHYCGDGVVDPGEQCDGGLCCTACCFFAPSIVQCRPKDGDCDVADYCTGTSSTCPNNYASSTTVCRLATVTCDKTEYCTGSSPMCPPDTYAPSTTLCRAAAGVCDIAEYCTGNSKMCPTDVFKPSSEKCRPSAGTCDSAEYCSGNSAPCPMDTVSPSGQTCRPSTGPCDPAEVCDGIHGTCPVDISGSWELPCPGLSIILNGMPYSWLNFDVISFGSFVANTGDIEGRLAVRNNAQMGNGWSVGYSTHSVATDQTLPFALVVGNSLVWGSGAVYPDGSNFPYPGAQENIFVGGTFILPPYLASRVTGNCVTAGCLNAQFDAVQGCYTGYQAVIGLLPDNVVKSIQFSGLTITCTNPTAPLYIVSLTPFDLTQFTYTTLNNCNPGARWVINIGGTGDATLTGGSFPANPAAVIYNFIGSGRILNIHDTQVDGTILAPHNTINQISGDIFGKVIAGDITASLQINKAQCFFSPPS